MNCVPHGWPGEGRRPLHGLPPELKERQHWSLPIEQRNLCDTPSFKRMKVGACSELAATLAAETWHHFV